MKKLYELERNRRIGISHLDMRYKDELITELNFHHIDGAYSYCTDDEGNVIYLSASTEVEDLKPLNIKYN